VSFDAGARWQSLSLNLPDVQVSGLVVEAHDLVIATHGRSFYVLDDIDALRQLTPEVTSAPAHLFQPRDGVRRVYPAVFDYYLRQPAASLVIEVVDPAGVVVRRMIGTSAPNRAGVNRVTWDLRYPGARLFEGMIVRSAQPAKGPLAAPGTYQVRLSADGQVQTRSFAVIWNPQLTSVTAGDLQAQFDLAMKIRNKTSEAHEAVIDIRAMKTQVTERLSGVTDARIEKAAEAFVATISAVEEELYQVRNRSPKDPLNYPVKLNNRIAALQHVVESSEARPTDQSYTVFALLSEELAAAMARLAAALNVELPALNVALAARQLAPVENPARR